MDNNGGPITAIGVLLIIFCVVLIRRRQSVADMFAGFIRHTRSDGKTDTTIVTVVLSLGLLMGGLWVVGGIGRLLSS